MFELPTPEAHLLIAEKWAEASIPPSVSGFRSAVRPHVDFESSTVLGRLHSTLRRLRQVPGRMEWRVLTAQERRRAEDRIREERHDAQARTITGS